MFLSAPVTVQTDLCGTWSETPKTGFLASRLIYITDENHLIEVYGHLHAKTNILYFRPGPTCTVTVAGWKLEIMDL